MVVNPKPVFIIYKYEKLYNDVSNWNMLKFKKYIFPLVDTFTNTEAAAVYLSIYSTLPKSNKRRHIKFYEEVKDEPQNNFLLKKIDVDDIEDQG